MNPGFSIHFGQSSVDCRIACNGHDITALVSKIVFTAQSGSLTSLELTASSGRAVADIETAIADVRVLPPPEENDAV